MKILVYFFCILTVFQTPEFVIGSSFVSSKFPKYQSCDDIKKHYPTSTSGYYPLITYCDMGDTNDECGSERWTRVAYLNMSNPSQSCPSGFREYQSGGVRVCGRQTSSGGSCQSIKFQTHISYSQVCGRVVGYQYKSPEAIYNHQSSSDTNSHDDINSYYVDGVSITHGSPRQHIWTMMGARLDHNSPTQYICPCSTGSTQTPQSFIGNDYFCESVNPSPIWGVIKQDDPLWDGKNCAPVEHDCCSATTGIPWFNKNLNYITTDDIELRVCADESTSDEDVPVVFYEIYIK